MIRKNTHLEVSSLPVVLDEVRLLELDSSSVHQVRSPLLQFRIVVAGFHWNSIQGGVPQHPEGDDCKNRQQINQKKSQT